jgi:hypothetical protein
MSNGSTGINIEDVQVMLQQLRRFRETIGSDWDSVTSQWQNLQSSWQDSQRNKFEPIFESLCETYSKSEQQQEEYIQFLESLIHAAENAMGMGSINNLNGFEQGALTSNTSLGLSKFSKEPDGSTEETNVFLNTASQGINNILKGANNFTRQTTTSIMMFSALLGGCISTYDKIISPILDINDKLISKIAPDTWFSMVSDSLNDAKEQALGSHVGEYEDLKVIKDKEKEEEEEKKKIADRVANKPKISSF